MNSYDKAVSLLPKDMRAKLIDLKSYEIEEFRVRLGRPLGIVVNGREHGLNTPKFTKEEINSAIERATDSSYHMAQSSLKDGYINYKGLRIGVCGDVNTQGGQVHSFRNINSLAIRIPKECRNICDRLFEHDFKNGFESSLIISPPGGGKTTALREMCRKLSEMSYRVSVVDEREEISGLDFELGEHSDVLSGINKAEGAMMLLRCMNPQIIAMDEITKASDLEAIIQIAGCGVQILATAHGGTVEELSRRRLYRDLLGEGVFKYLIVIKGSGGNRAYKAERIAK